MPELPEVTTTVKGLQKVLPGLVIHDVWTDLAKKNQPLKQFKETIKNATFYKKFKTGIMGAKIINVERRAKNILINLSNSQTILIHLKMTGHILYGEYTKKIITRSKSRITSWEPKAKTGPLRDPYNRFVHVVFSLSNGKHFVMCDSRKFGKVTMVPTDVIHDSPHLKGIGPEPLEKNFKYEKFKERLLSKSGSRNAIKTVLMDQSVIAGIGNIYSDEMLWLAGIHPESVAIKVPNKNLEKLYIAMKDVLNKGIDFGGDSMSDYRDVRGERGRFQNHHNVYRKAKEMCGRKSCRGVIMRKVINGRSAHFCSAHQKLFK